ncbi:tyrosine-type recombinase/integrase [Deinococcus sp.]|uniref:tyrosine-type recombinase/integrase n=1 Tax=Deinococcus sp. TaxID=47478 RepID=UPI003CC526A5
MTETKRAEYGGGSITEKKTLPDGKTLYRWRVYAVQPNGEGRRKAGSTKGTKRDAIREMANMRNEIERGGLPVNDDSATLTDLLEQWFSVKAGTVSARTMQIEREVSKLHILPRLGKIKVRAITAAVLQDFHTALATETTLQRSRKQIHVVLNQALNFACVRGYIITNPAKNVIVPQVISVQKAALEATDDTRAYTNEEATKLYAACMLDATPHAWAIALALQTGLRRGEVYGLAWANFSRTRPEEPLRVAIRQAITEHSGVAVVGPLKTKRSRRTLTLNRQACEVVEAARAWQEAQGGEWPFLFSERPDTMPRPGNSYRKLHVLQDRAEIRRLDMHSLRHTFASLAFEVGVPIEKLSQLLGHQSINVTQTVYVHLYQQAADSPSLRLRPVAVPDLDAVARRPIPPRANQYA